MGHSTKSLDDTFSLYTDCGSFIESTSLQSHKISKSTKPIVPKVTQRKSLSTFKQPNSSSSSFVAKPIKFINELAPDVPRPKPRLGTYVPTHSAIQQRARKEKRDRGKIKRSDNCFIIYRTHMHPYIVAAYGPQNNEVISKIAGSLWNSTPEWIKDIYRQKAYAAKLLRKEAILESLGSDGGSAGNVSLNEEITIRSTRPSPNPEAIANPKDGANTDDQELGSKYQSSSNEKGWKFHKGTRLPNGRKSGASYIQTTGLTRSDTLMPPQRSIIPEHYSTIPSVELPKVFTFVMQDPSTTVRKHSYVQPSKMPPMFIGPFAGMAPPNSTTTSSSLPLLPSSKLVATDVTLSELEQGGRSIIQYRSKFLDGAMSCSK
ncbi:hypothetical protein BGX27_005621 [Mortierella sp. AM989]|nr:hypothetical protein BGX27_005621 [Mortierella sp. AM989]